MYPALLWLPVAALFVIGAGIAIIAALRAPEGYEDEQGFRITETIDCLPAESEDDSEAVDQRSETGLA